jgi:hypothetical protein
MKEGLDTEKIRSDVTRVMTGMTPAFYDNGTHIIVHHKLDYDILKQIKDFDDILEVTGTWHIHGKHGVYRPFARAVDACSQEDYYGNNLVAPVGWKM